MKPIQIVFASILLLIVCFCQNLTTGYAVSRMVSVAAPDFGHGCHSPGMKLFAHMPIPYRKRYIPLFFKRSIWVKSKRVVKTGKSGKKIGFSTKQNLNLKKVVLKPA